MSDELKTIKFQLMLSPSEAELIDDWGFQNRIRTRAEAIRRLCSKGLDSAQRAETVTDMLVDVLSELTEELDKKTVNSAKKIAETIMFTLLRRESQFEDISKQFPPSSGADSVPATKETLIKFITWCKSLRSGQQ